MIKKDGSYSPDKKEAEYPPPLAYTWEQFQSLTTGTQELLGKLLDLQPGAQPRNVLLIEGRREEGVIVGLALQAGHLKVIEEGKFLKPVPIGTPGFKRKGLITLDTPYQFQDVPLRFADGSPAPTVFIFSKKALSSEGEYTSGMAALREQANRGLALAGRKEIPSVDEKLQNL